MISKKHTIIGITSLIIIGSIYFSFCQLKTIITKDTDVEVTTSTPTPTSTSTSTPTVNNQIPKIHNPGDIITEEINSSKRFYRIKNVAPTEVSSSTPTQGVPGEYSYLFEENRDPNISNIVGYFAHGAFAWYVPNWLVNNWDMKDFGDEGMSFSPKFRANYEDFSNIIFSVSTSTELNNAENSHFTMLSSIPRDEIIISEIVLNKAPKDIIGIQMENSTRIYHIAAYTRDFKSITDLYFMDGNGKTLDLRFETKSGIYSQFSDKIRDMVEGIGELKSPQG